MKLLDIGYKQYVNADKILSIVPSDSAPAKRSVQDAKEIGTLINASKGKKTLSIIFLEGKYVVTSSFRSVALMERAGNTK